jgi:hypothetical protein
VRRCTTSIFLHTKRQMPVRWSGDGFFNEIDGIPAATEINVVDD